MIDKKRIESIHKELNDVLKAFAVKNNLSMSPFNMSYSPEGFKFAVQMGDKSEIGDVDPLVSKNTKRYGDWYNLAVADIGKTFTYNGEQVVFNGLKNKNIALYTRPLGQRYKTNAMQFAVAAGRKTAEQGQIFESCM